MYSFGFCHTKYSNQLVALKSIGFEASQIAPFQNILGLSTFVYECSRRQCETDIEDQLEVRSELNT